MSRSALGNPCCLAWRTTAVSAAAGSWENFEAYPRLAADVDMGTIALAGALAVAALLPFADRRGVAAP